MKEVLDVIYENVPDVQIKSQFNGQYVKLHIQAAMFDSMKLIDSHRFIKSLLAPWLNNGTIHALELEVCGIGGFNGS